MSSLLNRLFRYRASEKRRPVEDFLSEILADFINRAPRAEAVRFIGECFVPASLRDAFVDASGDGPIAARTQCRLPNGKCLDLIIEVEDLALVVVENKVHASFQLHAVTPKASAGVVRPKISDAEADMNERSEREYDHQLVTYGRWLRETRKPAGWPGVLTVLTHASRPPADFVASNDRTYGAVPHLQLWRNLHGILSRTIGPVEDPDGMPAWRFVGLELCKFLEINAMDSSDLSAIEISAINVAMSPLRKTEPVFSEVGAELLQRLRGQFVRKGQDCIADHDQGRVWGWTYLDGPGKLYVGYGLCLAPPSGDLAKAVPPLPEHEHAFVLLGSDEHDLNLGAEGLPDGWSRNSEALYIVRPYPLTERRPQERFPQFLLRLVSDNMGDILRIRANGAAVDRTEGQS